MAENKVTYTSALQCFYCGLRAPMKLWKTSEGLLAYFECSGCEGLHSVPTPISLQKEPTK